MADTPDYIFDLDELAALFPDKDRRKFLGENCRALFKIDVWASCGGALSQPVPHKSVALLPPPLLVGGCRPSRGALASPTLPFTWFFTPARILGAQVRRAFCAQDVPKPGCRNRKTSLHL